MGTSKNDQLSTWIKRSNNILIASGDKFTGDGICSTLALQMILANLGKNVVSLFPFPIQNKYKFLDGINLIKTSLEEDGAITIQITPKNTEVTNIEYKLNSGTASIIVTPNSGNISPNDISIANSVGRYDLIITLNTPNLNYIGSTYTENVEIFTTTPIVNMATDPANEFYGKFNFVDLSKSSSCEIIFDWIINHNNYSSLINNKLATILLAGIIDSTKSFLNTKTSYSAFEAAGKLYELGAMQSDIIENLFKMKNFRTLKIWGTILGNLERDSTHRISWTTAEDNDFETYKSHPDDVGDLANDLLRYIVKTDLVVLFLENTVKTIIQIRIAPNIDITPEALKSLVGGEISQNGIDILVPKETTLTQVKQSLLKKITAFQNTRLKLSPEDSLKKDPSNIYLEKDFNNNQKTDERIDIKKEENTTPVVPEDIPFTTFLNTKKKSPIIENTPNTTKNSTEDSIPNWLKNT